MGLSGRTLFRAWTRGATGAVAAFTEGVDAWVPCAVPRRIVPAVCALVLAAVTACTGEDAPPSEKSSVAVTAAEGGELEREGLATVRIPPDGVSGDAVLRVAEGEGAVPEPATGFVPSGPR